MDMNRRHALLLPMALAACAEPPAPMPAAPPIAYGFLPRLRLDVAQVEIENGAPPAGAMDLGAQLRPTAAEAVQILGRDRLAAFGTQGVARFIVTRAVVLREPTARQGGIFSSDPGERLSCHLACRLEVLGADGAPRGFTQAELDHVTCPIGIPGIADKRPEAIAIAVAAQLLLLQKTE